MKAIGTAPQMPLTPTLFERMAQYSAHLSVGPLDVVLQVKAKYVVLPSKKQLMHLSSCIEVELYLHIVGEPKLPSVFLQVHSAPSLLNHLFLDMVLGGYRTADGRYTASYIVGKLCDAAEAYSNDKTVRAYKRCYYMVLKSGNQSFESGAVIHFFSAALLISADCNESVQQMIKSLNSPVFLVNSV